MDVPETRRSLTRPFLQLLPRPAQSDLADAGFGVFGSGGVPGCIVGVADDFLSESVKAVVDVREGLALVLSGAVLHVCCSDVFLFASSSGSRSC